MIKYNNVIKVFNCLDCKYNRITEDKMHVTCVDNWHMNPWLIEDMKKSFYVHKNLTCRLFEHAGI